MEAVVASSIHSCTWLTPPRAKARSRSARASAAVNVTGAERAPEAPHLRRVGIGVGAGQVDQKEQGPGQRRRVVPDRGAGLVERLACGVGVLGTADAGTVPQVRVPCREA